MPTFKPTVHTKAEQLKAKVLEAATYYMERTERYMKGFMGQLEIEGDLEKINECKELLKEFRDYTPKVYVYVEGGMVQGASGSEPIEFNIFDKDNFDASAEDEKELYGTPDEWNHNIEIATKENQIVAIY